MKQGKARLTRQPGTSEAWQVAGVCVFLSLAVLAVFGQTAGFGFVNYDDPTYVYENPVVQQGLTFKGALWGLTYGGMGHWHPLTWLTHMADCQMYGLWAGGHHLTNVVFHAGAAMLLFLVLRAMTGTLWRSAFVAAVFAVHPLRAESVAWIAECKDVLSGMFFMLTLWAYVNYARQPSRRRYVAVILLYALGLLSKNMLVTLPFVLLLLDWWPLGRMKLSPAATANPGVSFPALVKEKIPLFLLSVGSCAATALVPEHIWSLGHVPVFERVGNALVSYVIYLRQMVFPAGLAIPYLFPPQGLPVWKVCLAFVLLAGVTVGVVACWKKRPYLLVGWFWYLGMLVPAIGLVQISYYARADRYTYLPEIGLAIAVTWAVADWSAGWKYRRAALGGLMMAVIGALAGLSHIQTSYWRDSETLWTHTLACSPGNCVAHSCLGIALFDKGEREQAIAQYRKALEFKPDYAEALNNLGVALFDKGEKEQAIAQYRKALTVSAEFAAARNNLGVALFNESEKEQAIAQYRRALEIKPDDAEALGNLGVALFDKGERDEAIVQYRRALEADPHYVKAHYNWGNALASEGKMDEAIAQYRRALAIKPDYACACNSLGLVCFQKGEINEAINAWQQALAINPDQPSVQSNLAWLLATTPEASLRNGPKAVGLAEQANRLNRGGNPAVLHTLAAAYAEAGRFRDATATARRALELALAQKNDDLTARLPKEIKLYEADKPLRDAPQ
ncbi:MAG: tetratricopeptide repeat protein [Limisphaerales bacterium]